MSSILEFGSFDSVLHIREIVFFEIFRDQKIQSTHWTGGDGMKYSTIKVDYIKLHLRYGIEVEICFLPKENSKAELSVDKFAEIIADCLLTKNTDKFIALKKIRFKENQFIDRYSTRYRDCLYPFHTDWVLHPTLPQYIY